MTSAQHTPPNMTPGQQALLAHKVHVEPHALARSGGAVQERLSSAWQGAIRLIGRLSSMPETALRWWAQQPAGHIVLSASRNAYQPGTEELGQRPLRAVAFVPLETVVRELDHATILALFALDHLLGCEGARSGLWLSQGGGVNERWQRVGKQIASYFELGYALSDEGETDSRYYLAEGIVARLHHRRRLNTADPKLDRLISASLLSEPFWQQFAG